MPEADKILAEKLRRTENQIRQWINDNQYVWHERRDGRCVDEELRRTKREWGNGLSPLLFQLGNHFKLQVF